MKRLANIDKHGMDFAELDDAFFEAAAVVTGKRGRLIAVGVLGGPVTVVFSLLGAEAPSVISMRRASRQEGRLL